MKVWILVLLTTILLSFIQDGTLTIIPGQGVGSLELNKTTKRQVENYIGKGNPTKEFVSFCSHGQGTFKKIVYPDIGIELFYSNLTNPKERDTLTIIRILESSKIKTKEGVGIGSTRREVENYFGKANVSKFDILLSDKVYHSLRYNEIEFEFESNFQPAKDTMDYKVKRIEMWKN